MEVITIQSDAYNNIINRLATLEDMMVQNAKKQPLSETWLDIEETCRLLKVSKRTLQNYRIKGYLTYSHIGGKIYVSSSAIEEYLKSFSRKAFKKPGNIF